MNYIVLDLEWNQSVDGKEKEIPGFPFEIIEIGAIKLNNDREIIDEYSQVIRPQVYEQMSHITKKLIQIQSEELMNGKVFPEAVNEFLEWCGKDYIFCTWGPLDLTELQRNMEHYELPPITNGPIKFYDIQKLFSISFEDKKSRRTLEYAVDFLNLEKEIPFHRAKSDAYYTAIVFKNITNPRVLEKVSFDIHIPPKTRKEEIKIAFDDYAKYISRCFLDKAEAMEDREVSSTKCYLCHKNLKKKIRWFSSNSKHYYAVAHCDVHGYIKGKIRIKKTDQDQVYVVKTMKFIEEEDINGIRLKQDKARIQRQIKRQHKT